MRSSRLSIIKDFLGEGILIGFVSAVMLIVIPDIHEKENTALKEFIHRRTEAHCKK
ncbi:MAG: hypothetical protein KAZ87_02710 [Spirochaetes bacterium]|nr:hypothetical protein [Spirochaetota bacterium]